jgi:hypothetical protein
MKRLALCLILAILFAQPADAKDIACGWQNVASRHPDFTCRMTGEHGVTNVGVRLEDLTPSPEIVRLVARSVRGSEVDPDLVLAVIAAESAFDRQAVSPKNAVGLMQLMPETVARFGVRNPFDAEENVRAGTSYLQLLLRKYRTLKLALAAYNAGEGPVLSYGAVPPYEETTEYVARVLRLYERYEHIPFDRGEPAKVVSTTASTRAKGIGSCDLACRGDRLAAQLNDIGRRMLVSPSHPDAAWLGSASVASAQAD